MRKKSVLVHFRILLRPQWFKQHFQVAWRIRSCYRFFVTFMPATARHPEGNSNEENYARNVVMPSKVCFQFPHHRAKAQLWRIVCLDFERDFCRHWILNIWFNDTEEACWLLLGRNLITSKSDKYAMHVICIHCRWDDANGTRSDEEWIFN